MNVYLRDSNGSMIGLGSLSVNSEGLDANAKYGCGNYHGFGGTISVNVSSGTYFLRVALIDANGGAVTWQDG